MDEAQIGYWYAVAGGDKHAFDESLLDKVVCPLDKSRLRYALRDQGLLGS